jgi:hypothetical protein
MTLAFRHEAYFGAHDPAFYSADLQMFFWPNSVNALASMVPTWLVSPGDVWEPIGVYPGYVPLALAIYGAVAVPRARRYLFIAAFGAMLALGPRLHVAGRLVEPTLLPYGWLQVAFPALSFSGLPARFAWFATFGVSLAAGAAFGRLCQRRRLVPVAVALAVLSVAETSPRAFETSTWPRPPIFETWARDSGKWAVLDGTNLGRALWDQMWHHHPIIGGYATRVPMRLVAELRNESVLSALLGPPFGRRRDLGAGTLDASVADLRRLSVRYVVLDLDHAEWGAMLALEEVFRGDGVAIFRVPDGDRGGPE